MDLITAIACYVSGGYVVLFQNTIVEKRDCFSKHDCCGLIYGKRTELFAKMSP